MSELEINKAKVLSEIESEKFQQIVEAIGQDTLVSISSVIYYNYYALKFSRLVQNSKLNYLRVLA